MKKYLLLIPVLFLIATPVYASNTSGYAWSESLGWFDFSNVTVSDTAVTGYAYNDNTGWLVMDGITNTSGALGGYAWSESVGYFDFSDVTISTSNGAFGGYAYNDNTGWLSFGSGTNVTTTWRPPSTVTSSGSSVSGRIKNLIEMGKLEEAQKLQQQFPNANTQTTPSTSLGASNPQPSQTRDLKQGDQGNDVKSLQIILNLLNYQVAPSGPGSSGNETNYFGPLTREALIRFQLANNVQPPQGYFGSLTRTALIQKLISLLLTN
jgi:hypothetical protein